MMEKELCKRIFNRTLNVSIRATIQWLEQQSKSFRPIGIVFLSLLILSSIGCTSWDPRKWEPGKFSFSKKYHEVQGPDSLIKPESFEQINLALLLENSLDPNTKISPDPNGGGPDKTKNKKADESKVKEYRAGLAEAFNSYDKKYKGKENKEGVLARNRIQDRIIAASNQRCANYKVFIKTFDSESNFFLGALTTATAGAGAIFTPVGTVRALSGIAAIISGVRAELNYAYFQNQTVQVLT